MNEISEKIKDFFKKSGVPVFGIADSEILEKEPAGNRPSDLLPSAKSIICFGIPIPKGLFQDKKRINTNYWRIASIYYNKIDVISSELSTILEEDNGFATPVLS